MVFWVLETHKTRSILLTVFVVKIGQNENHYQQKSGFLWNDYTTLLFVFFSYTHSQRPSASSESFPNSSFRVEKKIWCKFVDLVFQIFLTVTKSTELKSSFVNKDTMRMNHTSGRCQQATDRFVRLYCWRLCPAEVTRTLWRGDIKVGPILSGQTSKVFCDYVVYFEGECFLGLKEGKFRHIKILANKFFFQWDPSKNFRLGLCNSILTINDVQNTAEHPARLLRLLPLRLFQILGAAFF